jgi:dipicolinate synthase subunit A
LLHYTKRPQKIKHHTQSFLIFWREGVMNLNNRVYYIAGDSPALDSVRRELTLRGLTVAQTPSAAVTHLVLGVPCRMGAQELETLLQQLSKDVRIFGGFLNREELQGYYCDDLLKDEGYLAQNAAITAHCALQVALEHLPVTLVDCPVLVLGWGRIGKCLASLLKALGAEVVIAARKEEHQAMIRALGYEAETLPFPVYTLPRFRAVFNTVPAPVLSEEAMSHCRKNCVKIELASSPGMEGTDILEARGLPGRLAPESSGKLIARTVLRLCARKEADT